MSKWRDEYLDDDEDMEDEWDPEYDEDEDDEDDEEPYEPDLDYVVDDPDDEE